MGVAIQQSGSALAATMGGTTPHRARILYAANGFGGKAALQSRDVWLLYSFAPPADSGLPQLLPLGVRLVGPAALLVLTSFLIFRRYTLPDEPPSNRV